MGTCRKFARSIRRRRRCRMTAWCISPFAVLLTSLSVSIAGAKELHPGIIGEDDRITIRADTSPWDAIGHVNVAGYRTISKCSGILIAPTAVLTAAHCLVDTREMAPVPPDRVHFLQAVHGGTWKGQSVAKCILFAGANSSTGLAHKDRWLRDDIAVIILKESLEGSRVEIAETLDTRPGTSLVHASYPADRRYALSADLQCRLLKAVPGLWFTNCDTHPASSGGPVFTKVDGSLKLAAIMVGTMERRFTLAVPSSEWLELARLGRCE